MLQIFETPNAPNGYNFNFKLINFLGSPIDFKSKSRNEYSKNLNVTDFTGKCFIQIRFTTVSRYLWLKLMIGVSCLNTF